MRILVVDPSRTMRNIARAVLAQIGYYDVEEAPDAAEALTRSRFAQFDLYLIDASFHDSESPSLVSILRRVSGSAGFVLLRASLADPPASEPISGDPSVLLKPFAPEALRRCIAATCTPGVLPKAA